MKHNFSIQFKTPETDTPQWFEVQIESLEDAMIALYEAHGEDVIYLTHEVEYNSTYFESDSDLIKAALLGREKK